MTDSEFIKHETELNSLARAVADAALSVEDAKEHVVVGGVKAYQELQSALSAYRAAKGEVKSGR
jgi:hypothetical protein